MNLEYHLWHVMDHLCVRCIESLHQYPCENWAWKLLFHFPKTEVSIVVIAILAECCEGKEVMGDILALRAAVTKTMSGGWLGAHKFSFLHGQWTLGHLGPIVFCHQL